MTVQHGKKYEEAIKLLERSKTYEPAEAVALAKKAAYANFDETVELH
ncbi:MAG: 50S ribosomal protein L1, partial [Dehalococcoidales bacterium]|nr:50S ribosomal protein L1 [Dehalococcoidales bacterium]